MTLGIVQARLGSTRLPGKVLMDLLGKPMLVRELERLDHCTTLDALVVATSDSPQDDPLAGLLEAEGRDVFRGSEVDVLDRYYRCAKQWQADVVVRITGDCPLICPDVLDAVVRLYHAHPDCEYGNNAEPPTYPDGLDTEVFPWRILELMWRRATGGEREHVTPYVRLRPDQFRHCTVRHEADLSWMRWTVDEPRDLEFVRRVYSALYQEGSVFGMDAILRLLAERPELTTINQGIPRDLALKRLREARKERCRESPEA